MDIIIKCTAAFVEVVKPREFKAGDGKPRWSITGLVTPGSKADKDIRAAIQKEAENVYKDKAASKLKAFAGQGNKYCYLDGDTKDYDGFAGKWALTMHRAQFNKNGTENPPPICVEKDAKTPAKPGKIYGGAEVNIKCSIYAQSGENEGIRASFSAVQFVADGEAFGAAPPTTDGFEAMDDEEGEMDI